RPFRSPRSMGARITREAHAREGPALVGMKEIAVRRPRVPARGDRAAASQHPLPAHELAVVFAERARRRLVAGVRLVSAARPLPNVAVELGEPWRRRGARVPTAVFERARLARRGAARG